RADLRPAPPGGFAVVRRGRRRRHRGVRARRGDRSGFTAADRGRPHRASEEAVSTRTWSLLDEALPECDYRSRHGRHVLASPEDVAGALARYRLDRDSSPLVRLLFRLRGLRI